MRVWIPLSMLVAMLLAGCQAPDDGAGIQLDACVPGGGSGPAQTQAPPLEGDAPDGDPIRIGALMPLTGAAASLGVEAMRGAEIAVDEINAQGGINGRPLELVKGDTAFPQTDQAVAEFNTMADAGIQFVVGALASDSTDAVQSLATDNEIVLVSPSSTRPDLTGPDHGYFFRVIANDTVQGPQAAQLLFEDLAVEEVAVMYQQTGYAQGLRDTFVAAFESLGGDVLGSPIAWENDPGTFDSKAAEAVNLDPPVIWISGQAPEIANLIQALRDQGFAGTVVTSEAIEDGEIFNVAQDALGHVCFTKASPDIASEAYGAYQSRYVDRHGSAPGAFSPFAYDAVYVGAAAIEAAGDNGPAIKAWLESNTISGRITTATIAFNDHGDVTTGGYSLWVIDSESKTFRPV